MDGLIKKQFPTVFAASICLAIKTVEAIPTLGKCEWSGTVATLNSSIMTPTKCSEIGGNCCNWFGASWDGGVSVYYENPVLIKHQRTLCKGCFFRLDDFSREGEESTEKSLAFLYYLLPFFLIVLILLIFILYQKSIYDHQKTTVSQETLISVTKDKYSLCPTDPPVSV